MKSSIFFSLFITLDHTHSQEQKVLPIDHFISTLRDCIVEYVKTNQYHISSENTKYLFMNDGSKTTLENDYNVSERRQVVFILQIILDHYTGWQHQQ